MSRFDGNRSSDNYYRWMRKQYPHMSTEEAKRSSFFRYPGTDGPWNPGFKPTPPVGGLPNFETSNPSGMDPETALAAGAALLGGTLVMGWLQHKLEDWFED